MSFETDFAKSRNEIKGKAGDALIGDLMDPAIKLYVALDKDSPSEFRQIATIMLPMAAIGALVNAGLLSAWLALNVAKDGVLVGFEVVEAKAKSALKTAERVAVDVVIDGVNAGNRAYHAAEKAYQSAKQTAESVLEALARMMTNAYKAAKEVVFGKPEAETVTLSSSASAPNLGTTSTAKIGSLVGLSASAPNLTTPTPSVKKEVEPRQEPVLVQNNTVTSSCSMKRR